MLDDFELPLYPCLEEKVDFWQKIFASVRDHQLVVFDPDSNFIMGKFRSRGRENPLILSYLKTALERWHARPLPDRKYAPHHPLFWVREQRLSGRDLRQQLEKLRIQRGFQETLQLWHQRSLKYLPEIVKKLKDRGMPKTLAFLPFIESGFDPQAHSRAGAKGIWQLMEETMKSYYTVDLRHSFAIATDVALDELSKNYDLLKRWPLAITAYNSGRHRVARVVDKIGTRDFCSFLKNHEDPAFGFDGQNFYAELLAIRRVMITLWAKELQKRRHLTAQNI
jgi:membrane-bound lytic murein transglycosylase D